MVGTTMNVVLSGDAPAHGISATSATSDGTGTANLNETAQMQAALGASWNNQKFQDEYELTKTRLSDQTFTTANSPDPLLPRQPHPKQYPNGVTVETEERLKSLIAKLRAEDAQI